MWPSMVVHWDVLVFKVSCLSVMLLLYVFLLLSSSRRDCGFVRFLQCRELSLLMHQHVSRAFSPLPIFQRPIRFPGYSECSQWQTSGKGRTQVVLDNHRRTHPKSTRQKSWRNILNRSECGHWLTSRGKSALLGFESHFIGTTTRL